MATVAEKIGRVLIVDDDQDILTAAQLLLKQHVAHVDGVSNPEKILSLMASEGYDLVLLDMNFSRESNTGQEGFYWLKRILSFDPTVVVILITAFGDMEMAIRAIKMGATDFIVKPWQNEKLLATLHSALALRSSRAEVKRLRVTQQVLSNGHSDRENCLVGHSPAQLKVQSMIDKVAASDASVLLLGENGTGKELVARAIYHKSKRAGEPFISVDMGSISETLFETELFGHVKGAYTDARQDKAGRFEIADRGTLFFDEIGNLNLAQQAKLLTALEQRQVTRVGSNVSKPIDIRLICATNRPLHQMVSSGAFRMDLLYRINTVEIYVPPLRERRDDIPALARLFLNLFAGRYHKEGMRLAPEVLPALCEYPWPGNIRELKHAMERAVILAEDPVLHAWDFCLANAQPATVGASVPDDTSNLEEIERRVITHALRRCNGNISRTAQQLGLTRTSLYRRMEKYGL
jgi:DNA-binding NtrC family response regulator